MSFEDEIRAAMAAHEDEAPSTFRLASGLLVRPSRIRTVWAIAAVVLTVLAVVVAVATTRNRTRPTPSSHAATTCPAALKAHDPYWVPALPSGIDGASRLIPTETPLTASVCGYGIYSVNVAARASTKPHNETRMLTGDLNAITQQLAWMVPKHGLESCDLSLVVPTDAEAFLVRLTYADGSVWLAVPGNHCGDVSNGVFQSSTTAGASAASALATGVWPKPKTTPCQGSDGRLGQQTALVPDHPTSVTVCSDASRMLATSASAAQLTELVDDLNASPSTADPGLLPHGCSGQPKVNYGFSDLQFTYDSGPVVDVGIVCGTLFNGSFSRDMDASVLHDVQQILRH